MGGNIIADFSLPSFNANFTEGKITNAELYTELATKIELFSKTL